LPLAGALCWPVAETGAAVADAAVAGVALGDVFAFAPAGFMPRLGCSACCFPVGVALAASPGGLFISRPGRPAAGFGVVSAFCAVDGARSGLAPRCGFAAVASGLAPVVPGFVGAACVFSAPCFFSVGVDCCSGGCAIAAPANASEKPISKLVNFFILISLVVRPAPSIRTLKQSVPRSANRSPNNTSRDRSHLDASR
jgi:hypothetical protein